MVKVASAVLLFMGALGVQASATCQCLFFDGSHCCVYNSANGPTEDCLQACSSARRSSDNKPCGAGGKWSKVSAWNANWREGCAR